MARSLINNTSTFAIIVVLLSFDYLLPIWQVEAGVLSLTTKEASSSGEFEIAKCRQRCFQKTLDQLLFRHDINSVETVESCHQNPNCFMCFDYCHVLTVAVSDLANSMCNDTAYCSKGCRTACDFYRIKVVDELIDDLVHNS